MLLAFANAAEVSEPTVLPPWYVVETPLQPDAKPIRASALLPEEAWSGRAIATMADAFRQIPGAIMLESFGGFEPPRFSIRGSGLQSAPSSRGVALLFDQLPLGLADGSFNSALFDPLLGARVEVQRGLDGWRSAPSALGGAIDLRTAHAPTITRAARFEAGSFGAARARLLSSATASEITAVAALSFAEQDGYREHSAQRRTAASIAATAGRGLSFGVYHAHARYDVPGPLTLTTAMTSPRSISADVRRDRPGRVSELTRGSVSFVRANAEREFELGAAFAHSADDFRQLFVNGVTRSRSDDASVRALFGQRYTLGATPHLLRATLNAARGWRDVHRFANQAGTTGERFGYDAVYPTTATLQVEDAFALTRSVVGTVGVARYAAEREVLDRLSGPARGAPVTTLKSRATLPQASVRWRFAKDATVFATVSRAAEAPTFDDLVSITPVTRVFSRRIQPLALQRALTWELGARGRTGTLSWDLAAYRAAWRDEILRLADANGAPRGAVNAPQTLHEGIETSFRWQILDGDVRLSLAGSGVWTRFIFDDDPVFGRNRLAGLPPHLGDVELLAEFPRGTFLAFGADWTKGQTHADHAGRLSYGGRTLEHIRIGWRAPGHWTFFVDVRNVFDRRTIASTAGVLDVARNPAATAIFLPAPGRAITFGIEWQR